MRSVPGESGTVSKDSSAFGEVARSYDRSRPGHPDSLVADVLDLCAERAPRVIEIGAGTGKSTLLFARRGLDILAIEPSPEMATIGRRNCAEYPSVSFHVSTVEDWPTQPEASGLLVSAQAWHWVAPEVRYRKAHEVLRQSGGLAVFWSRPLLEESALSDALAATYSEHAPNLFGRGPWFPGFRASRTEQVTEGRFGPGDWLPEGRPSEIDGSGYFEAATERSYRWELEHTAGEYVDLLSSLPEHEALLAGQRQSLFAAITAVINASGGVLTMDYETRLYFAHRA